MWSTFTTESPVWRDDDPVTGVMEQVPNDFGGRAPSGGYDRRVGQSARGDDTGSMGYDDRSGGYGYDDQSGDVSAGVGRRPYGRSAGRATLTPADRCRPPVENRAVSPSAPIRQVRPGVRPRLAGDAPGPTAHRSTGRTGSSGGFNQQRNMSTAVAFGVGIAAAFILALIFEPKLVLAIIVVVLGIAGFEYFGKVTEKGVSAGAHAGDGACVFAPLAAYWAR